MFNRNIYIAVYMLPFCDRGNVIHKILSNYNSSKEHMNIHITRTNLKY